jgi:hypothetical protein
LLAAWVGAGEGFTRSSISINSEVHSRKNKTKPAAFTPLL